MLVEMVGASGSGKTTVALGLLNALRDISPARLSLAKLSGRKAPSLEIVGSLIFLPGIMGRLANSSSDIKTLWRSARFQHRLKLGVMASRNRVYARSKSLFLHDQGLVQALGYLSRDWPDGARYERITQLYRAIGRSALPSLIVAFSVEPTLVSGRTKLRGPRYQDLNEIKRTAESLDSHVAILRERFGVRVVALNNDTEIARAVDQASAAIVAMRRVEAGAEDIRLQS